MNQTPQSKFCAAKGGLINFDLIKKYIIGFWLKKNISKRNNMSGSD